MQAAVISAPGQLPLCTQFRDPAANDSTEETEIVTVTASAISPLAKARSSGSHYSSTGQFPLTAGVDGVGRTADGRRVYFALPESPFGSFAEKTLVDTHHLVPIPDTLDDITAAALANPGMSAWAALVERARLTRGETVLIHGATSTAGRIAVQLAKFLGAGKIIATGRNPTELNQLLQLGADETIPLNLDPPNPDHPHGATQFEEALISHFTQGIDIVIDYLWGQSALSILTAITQALEDAHPVRFIQVGSAAGEPTIALPASHLRSSAVQLMGSGIKSIPLPTLLQSIAHIFESAQPANLQIETQTMPLTQITQAWQSPSKPRIVITIP